MTDRLGRPELRVPTTSGRPALIPRPWQEADLPALAIEMGQECLLGGMWSGQDERPFQVRSARQGTRSDRASDEREAARWLGSQDRGWRDGDRLCFAVLRPDDARDWVLAGNVGLKNRDGTDRIGAHETAEIGYWTAVAARGRGLAPTAVFAATE